MILSIRNFRGVKRAEIDLEGIALIAGRNEAGKSSIAQALQALLTGEPIPLGGLRKSDAAMLIHAGTGNGEISLSNGDDSRASIEYPKAKRVTEGAPPWASPIAVGMESLADMDPKARASLLIDYLKAAPTQTDLRGHLEDSMPAATIDLLWEAIEQRGWDAAWQHAKEKGQQLKGQWREATGEMYGSDKGSKWIPDAWESDLDGASEESLRAVLVQAEESRDAVVASEAVSAERISQLKNGAALLPELKAKTKKLEAESEALAAEVVRTGEILRSLPSPGEEIPTVPCPHPECGRPVLIVGHSLRVPPTAVNDEERAKRRQEGEEAAREYSKATQAQKRHDEQLNSVRADLARCESAARELEATKETGSGVADAAAIERARAEVQHAQGRLAAYLSKTRADALHGSITANQQIIDLLAPDGLRQTKLRGALKALNERVAEAASVCGWAPAEITPALEILYRGTAWALCSESGRYRARVLLQLALAEIDDSQALVIDGADILDKGGRNGLMKLLRSATIPALVCMTLPAREDMPDLGRGGLGRSYWIEQGEVR